MKLIRKTSDANTPEKSSGNLFLKLIPYWPLFLTLFVLAIAGAWLYLQLTAPLYEANARILINEKKRR